MKYMHLFFLTSVSIYSFGQQSVNTTGGDIQSSQGSVSYSIGQVATNYIENGSNHNEGVQQPYEFFQVLSVESFNQKSFIEIYPNPTEGIFYLKSEELLDAAIEILDASGRLVWSTQLKNVQTSQIDLSSFANGVYSIKITETNSYQVIKIIKN